MLISADSFTSYAALLAVALDQYSSIVTASDYLYPLFPDSVFRRNILPGISTFSDDRSFVKPSDKLFL